MCCAWWRPTAATPRSPASAPSACVPWSGTWPTSTPSALVDVGRRRGMLPLTGDHSALEGNSALSLGNGERPLHTSLDVRSIRARTPAERFAAEAVELRLAPAPGAPCHLVDRLRPGTKSWLSLAGL